jgi:23S rRNA (adenine2503-C2)-methyltransferase
LGQPAYRSAQLYSWLHKKGVFDFDQMSNLPKSFKSLLKQHFTCEPVTISERQIDSDGTAKYRFSKGPRYFEAVYIPQVAQSNTNTLCISSQAGCSLGCRFCYTASLGPGPDLSSAEIVSQYHAVWRDLGLPSNAAQGKVTNIVFMGMGEPLLNLEAVMKAISIYGDQAGLDISSRRITVSTAGIVPGIDRLGRECDVQLAVSLNAVDDSLRSELMPINRKWPLDQLMQSLKAYPLARRRRISIEYIMLQDVNDSLTDAKNLVRWLAPLKVKVNLIPFNAHPASPLKPSAPERIATFKAYLQQHAVTAIIRNSRGFSVSAACGLLGER